MRRSSFREAAVVGGWQRNNGKNCAKLLGCRSTRSWLASRREGNCFDLEEREREVAKNEECEKSRGCNENCMIQDGAKINTFHVYHAPSTLLQAARLLVLKSSISLFTCLVSWKNSLFTVNPFSDSFHRNFSWVKHITLPRNHFLIKFITFFCFNYAARRGGAEFNSMKLHTKCIHRPSCSELAVIQYLMNILVRKWDVWQHICQMRFVAERSEMWNV